MTEDDATEFDPDATLEETLEGGEGGRSRLEVLGRLGAGAAGVVHRVLDRELQRTVALKEVKDAGSASDRLLGRFLAEARITAQLDHPHIVPIYALEHRADGSIAFTMKLIEGQTLKELLSGAAERARSGRPPLERHSLPTLLEHFVDIVDAVAYAHARGVLHRDLKPSNVMIGRFHEVYVMDWGIARLTGEVDEGLDAVRVGDIRAEGSPAIDATAAGSVVGTPRYLSPEQASGGRQPLDHRSDQYTLGLILQEILTLEPPRDGRTIGDLLEDARHGVTRAIGRTGLRGRIPVELAAIARKATARDPDGRYLATADLAADVRRHLRRLETVARPDRLAMRPIRWLAHHPSTSLAVLLALVVLAAAAVVWGLTRRQAEERAGHLRHERLMAFQIEVDRQSDLLDGRFLRAEGLVRSLAAAAVEGLDRPGRAPAAAYEAADFDDAARRPDDLVLSSLYSGSISPGWPVLLLSAGADREAALAAARPLADLRHRFRAMFLDAMADPPVDPDAAARHLAEGRSDLVWAFVGLEAGAAWVYPGRGLLPLVDDIRSRPWYRLGIDHREPCWGAPYRDALGAGLVIPCAMAISSPDRPAAGVAGVELGLDRLVGELMKPPDVEGLVETFLVDRAGTVVIASSGSGAGEPFPFGDVVDRFRGERGGTLSIDHGGRALVVAYAHLEAVEWYHVVVAGRREIVDPGGPASPGGR